MDAVTYPMEQVQAFINQHFVPFRVMYLDRRDVRETYGVNWTPTVILVDLRGRPLYRISGFLPPGTFLRQLILGKGYVCIGGERYQEGLGYFEQIAARFPDSPEMPEALYWRAVCRYRLTHKGGTLTEARRELEGQFPDSEWTERTVVWGH